ncbi:hypothetical protein PR002_g22451 [Phytophthora rubi]|uniref:PiggyBac transposable element-derived protein domain-containing protein n=2 Tax=Phytophthora rubi TaxID=129364 RepID=A0A6A3ISZ2_9STRA|nr:hypothetical protein PR002_g22451 [Phytophthora rubi]
MPMKPNKWGTEFYLTCCADTAYCSRLDIYCGKANDDETAIAQRAVVKNLAQVLRGQPAQRLICTDNFYTSIPLSHKLLSMGHSHVGTIRKDRKGWCTGIEFSQKRRPKRMDTGTYRVALWKDHPEYVALTWMDNKPVRFLATGCPTRPTRVSRRERDGSVSVVPCPQLVRGYHEAMGGVDVHDQLRLQRYSIQRAIRMRKYYKAIFLGLVDLAMVNAFIVHKIAMRRRGKPVPTHAAFLRALHTDLINQTSEDFAGRDDMADLVAEPLPRVPRALEKTDEMNGAKRRQWLCKVCSAYAGAGVRSFETSFFCATCSRAKKGRVTLCKIASPPSTRQFAHVRSGVASELEERNGDPGGVAAQDKVYTLKSMDAIISAISNDYCCLRCRCPNGPCIQ